MKLTKGKPDISGGFADLIPFGDETLEISYLDGVKPAEGGNGLVFKAVNNQTGEEYAVKFCKFPQQTNNEKDKLKRTRFSREINALQLVAQDEFENVVRIIDVGEKEIEKRMWDYYIMEKCDCSLDSYLDNQQELTVQQKIFLFDKIVNGISYLHKQGIYHRDIKGENILVLDDEPKICDLGLSIFRPIDVDLELAEFGQMVGPTGWFSPEATNKFLVEGKASKYSFDCVIGAKSDVFQLGKLFWYIMQGNLPLGQITKSDFVASKSRALYSAIRQCLAHSSKRRISLEVLQDSVRNLFPEFGL